MEFEGDSLGIDVAIPAPGILLLYVTPATLALYWGVRDRTAERGPKPSWGRISTADAVGVILTICQWIAVVASLAPWGSEMPLKSP